MKKIISIIALLACASLSAANYDMLFNQRDGSGVSRQRIIPATGNITTLQGMSDWIFSVPVTTANITTANVTTLELSAALRLFSAAAPTTGSAGYTAFDNNAWASGRGTIQFYDGTANVYVVAPLASDTPTNGQVPKWNTGGTITWEADGGGTPGGSDTQVQFNNSSAFGGDAGLTFNSTTDRLTSLGGVTVTQGTTNTSVFSSTGYSLTGSNATSLIDLAGTWNTTGAPLGIKFNLTYTAADAAARMMDLQVGGVTKFSVDRFGVVRTAGGVRSDENINVEGGASFTTTNRSQLKSNADGNFTVYDSAVAAFGLFQFGGTTSSFPALKRNTTSLEVKLADDSAYTRLNVGTLGVASGSNLRAGTFTLSSGAATVNNTSVTANSVIVMTVKTVSGTVGSQAPFVTATSVGTSFTVLGAGTNNSTYNYIIFEIQ